MAVESARVADALKKILEALSVGPATQTARALFDMLIRAGFSEETASRAIASGSRNGDFVMTSQLKVSRNGSLR